MEDFISQPLHVRGIGKHRRVDVRLRQQSNAVPESEFRLAQRDRDRAVDKSKLSGELRSTPERMTFQIIDPPCLPIAPVGPNRPLLYRLTLLAAIGAGIHA